MDLSTENAETCSHFQDKDNNRIAITHKSDDGYKLLEIMVKYSNSEETNITYSHTLTFIIEDARIALYYNGVPDIEFVSILIGEICSALSSFVDIALYITTGPSRYVCVSCNKSYLTSLLEYAFANNHPFYNNTAERAVISICCTNYSATFSYDINDPIDCGDIIDALTDMNSKFSANNIARVRLIIKSGAMIELFGNKSMQDFQTLLPVLLKHNHTYIYTAERKIEKVFTVSSIHLKVDFPGNISNHVKNINSLVEDINKIHKTAIKFISNIYEKNAQKNYKIEEFTAKYKEAVRDGKYDIEVMDIEDQGVKGWLIKIRHDNKDLKKIHRKIMRILNSARLVSTAVEQPEKGVYNNSVIFHVPTTPLPLEELKSRLEKYVDDCGNLVFSDIIVTAAGNMLNICANVPLSKDPSQLRAAIVDLSKLDEN